MLIVKSTFSIQHSTFSIPYMFCLGFDGVSCPISARRVIDRPRQCQRAARYQLSAASQAMRRYAASFQSSCPQLEAGSWKLETFFQLNILQTVVLPVAPQPRGATADVPHCTSQCEHCSKKKMVKPHG
jgi:hypothetical protein